MKYRTDFPATENPVSENGNWLNGLSHGLDWADVVTSGGLARGTGGDAEFGDPTAILTGDWSPDQRVEAVVFSRNPILKYCQEVEIRLRSSMAPRLCTGYEILFRCLKNEHAYMEVVRWEGPLAKFTYLFRGKGAQYGVRQGDVVEASIVGDSISVFINRIPMATVRDNIFKTGNPGMGFNFGCKETYPDFGFSSFIAAEIF